MRSCRNNRDERGSVGGGFDNELALAMCYGGNSGQLIKESEVNESDRHRTVVIVQLLGDIKEWF